MVRAAIALLLLLAAHAPAAHAAGFQFVSTPDDAGRPIELGIWYPSDAPVAVTSLGDMVQSVAVDGAVKGERLPVVVFSHGNGGWFGDRAESARILAGAGFVAVSLTHPGDSYKDHGDTPLQVLLNRPKQISRVLDYMTKEWPQRGQVDAGRIGFYGFSAGGFTGLVLLGGVPDFRQMKPHCAKDPADAACTEGYADFLSTPKALAVPASAWQHDARIRAAVLAAPGLAFSFDPASLRANTAPVDLWGGSADKVVPFAANIDFLRTRLAGVASVHDIEGAQHMSFLSPCSDALRARHPDICSDLPGFDRVAFQGRLNADLVRFFRAKLVR